VDRLGIAIPSELRGEVIGRVQEPSVARIGRKQCERADGDEAPVVCGGAALDIADFVGQPESLPLISRWPGPRRIFLRPTVALLGVE
jgi:hypothetical protein